MALISVTMAVDVYAIVRQYSYRSLLTVEIELNMKKETICCVLWYWYMYYQTELMWKFRISHWHKITDQTSIYHKIVTVAETLELQP